MSARDVEFGVFLPVSDGGFIFSNTAPVNPSTYEYIKKVTKLAEDLGMGFAIALARWRGFGGTHGGGYGPDSLEAVSTIAGIAEATSRIRVFCTMHTMAFHPAVAAKMIATIDQIAHGRLGLNIVAGSNPVDHGQMGIWRKDIDHNELYSVATEWITVMKRLWTEERVEFKGKHYTLTDCESDPKPVQKPHPSLICAAVSDTGYEFTMRHADASLVNGTDIDDLVLNGTRNKAKAKELGTNTKTVGLVMMVPGETDAAAEERVRAYDAGADAKAIATRTWQYSQSAREWSHDEQVRMQYKAHFPDGKTPQAVSRSRLVGSPDTLVEKVADLIERGQFDWLVFYFPDYLRDVETFGKEVLPKLVARGVGRMNTPHPTLSAAVPA
ncbi:MAG: LLM class flavin-dependent oxidoreductase [Chloroflexi bacterium]|nr:LLM class flavin-dependent oxidoreductase [Chloroflexota bacterium]